jgi:hypothetical protein
LVLTLVLIFWAMWRSSDNNDYNESSSEAGSQESSQQETVVSEEPDRSNYVPRVIDGVLVEPGQENIPPIAVMIDNMLPARPQSGIARASIVYEAEAEGGVTRFLAIYAAGEQIDEIGPVRSARPYFIDLAQEYGAMYVHCGGSPDALSKIIREKVFNLNQFYNGQSFWRSDKRLAPHNIMTSSALLGSQAAKKKVVASYEGWNFSSSIEKVAGEHLVKVLSGSQLLTSSWRYDGETGLYFRYQGDKKYLDASGEEISVSNLVIQKAKHVVLDEKQRLDVDVVGQGEAYICRLGLCLEATWSKASAKKRTVFKVEGQLAEFTPGNFWVWIVRPYAKLKVE